MGLAAHKRRDVKRMFGLSRETQHRVGRWLAGIGVSMPVLLAIGHLVLRQPVAAFGDLIAAGFFFALARLIRAAGQ